MCLLGDVLETVLISLKEMYPPKSHKLAKHQIEFFQPTYMNYAIELNLYYHNCPSMQSSSWLVLKSMCNEVYGALKAEYQNIVFFPSFGIYKTEGMSSECNSVETVHSGNKIRTICSDDTCRLLHQPILVFHLQHFA